MMKQLCLVIAALLISVAAAGAVTVSEITVDWGFDTQDVPEYAPAGVTLFADGVALCTQPAEGGETGRFTCRDVEVAPGSRAFTIAIEMANGKQTAPSNPYPLTIPIPDPLAPTIIEFYLRVTVDGQAYEFTTPDGQ